jgi:hypothetical protein
MKYLNKTIFITKMTSLIKITLLIVVSTSVLSLTYTPQFPMERRINNLVMYTMQYPQVAALDNGGLVNVYWWDIIGPNLLAVARNSTLDVRVEINYQTVQSQNQWFPGVTHIGNNRFVLLWQDTDQSTRNWIKFRVADFPMKFLTGEIIANTQQTYNYADWNTPRINNNPKEGGFAICWNYIDWVAPHKCYPSCSFMDKDYNIITKDIKLDEGMYPFPCALNNGNYVIVVQYQYNAYFYIYNARGDVRVAGRLQVNFTNYVTGNGPQPNCSGTTDGGFVVVFFNPAGLAFRMFDQNGNPKHNSDIKYNTNGVLGGFIFPKVGGLPTGGFVLWYDANSDNVDSFYKVYAYDGTQVIAETRMNIYTNNVQKDVAGSVYKDGSFVAVWMSQYNGPQANGFYDIFGNVYKFQGDCYSFSTSAVRLDPNHILFTTLPSNNIRISTLPTTGGLYKVDGSTAWGSVNFEAYSDLYYKTSVNTADSFYYQNHKGDVPCKVDIVICYSSCLTCNTQGDINDHKCTACITNYHTLYDKGTNCETEPLIGYYYEPINSMFQPCPTGCASCDATGEHLCSSCKDNYFLLPSDSTKCYIKPDETTPSPAGYYFNGTGFTKCDKSCSTCDVASISCTSCNYDLKYYPMPGDSTKCVLSTAPIEGFFFDHNTGKITKCAVGCKTCTDYKDYFEQFCDGCKENEGYLPQEGTKNCYLKDDKVEGYYYSIEGKFMPCYPACKTCKGKGDIRDPNCEDNSCKEGMNCAPCTGYIQKDECVSKCKEGLFQDETSKSCYECKDKGLVSVEGICKTSCPTGYFPDEKSICQTCMSIEKVYSNGSCAESCLHGFKPKEGICVPQTDCSDTYCLNGGTCGKKFNQLSCQCDILFTGNFCDVKNDPHELSGYISNFSLNIGTTLSTLPDSISSDDFMSLLNVIKILKDNPSMLTESQLLQVLQIIVKQVDYAVKNPDKTNFDALQLANGGLDLYNLAVSKGLITDTSKYDPLVKELKQLVKSLIETNVANNGASEGIIGNDQITAQISSSDTQEEALKQALANGLSIVNVQDCLETLRKHYDLTAAEKFIISKTDVASDKSNTSKSVKIDIYTSNRQKLDLSLCETSITIKIPLTDKDKLDTIKYDDYKTKDIDIYDPDDPAFNSRCYSYQDKGYDTTVNDRIKKIYSQTSITCSEGCTYKGLDKNKYVQCDCINVTDASTFLSSFADKTLKSFSNINLDLVSCPPGKTLNVIRF